MAEWLSVIRKSEIVVWAADGMRLFIEVIHQSVILSPASAGRRISLKVARM